MAASVVDSDCAAFETSFVVVATTANQVALSIDLSAYGTASNSAGYHFIFIITTLNQTPSARVDSIWDVQLFRQAAGSVQIHSQTAIKAPTDAFVDFALSSNTLQCRIDGGVAETPVSIYCEGPVGEAVPA